MKSYLELLRDVMENGETHDDRTGVGTYSVFGRQWRHDMQSGFPLITTKQVPLRWVFEELRWFLSGSTNVADLQAAGVDIWDEWATAEQCAKFGRRPGELGPIYGELWRRFPSIQHGPMPTDGPHLYLDSVDQIKYVMDSLENNPNSRRIICSGWHPRHQSNVALPPCHTIWQIKSHADGALSLHLYARSIDIFLGLPFNIASYGLLLEMIARVFEKPARELIISFGDLHLYKSHTKQAKTQLSREPHDLPEVQIFTPTIVMEPLKRLLGIKWSDVVLSGYQHHPKISAPVAI